MVHIATSFHPESYPKHVSIRTDGKDIHSLQRLKVLTEFNLNKHGVDDYYVFHDKKLLTFHFRSVREQMIGQGCLLPDIGAQFPLLEFQKIHPSKLLEIATNLERAFNNAGRLHQEVKLLPDVESHSIEALVKNGPDIIQVMKWSEKLQAKFAPV